VSPRTRSLRARRLRPLLPAFALGALLLAGCGSGGRTLDNAAVQRAIARTILAQRHIQVAVSCPSGLPSKADVHFVCLAKLDVGSYPVPVAVTNDAGHVVYRNQAPLVALDTPHVERAIGDSILRQRRARAQVSCPAEVLQQADLRFTCRAEFDGGEHPFAVREVDDHGRVRYEEVTTPA
jgi:Domain of unknown function (DUF4333)